MFTSAFSIITTRDMPSMLAFYRDQLAASVSFEFPGPDGNLVHVAKRGES